jgi:PAS domain S-box-containing protein
MASLNGDIPLFARDFVLPDAEALDKTFRLLLEVPFAICLIHRNNFTIQLVNERQEKIWGKSANEVLGKPLFELFPEVSTQGFEKILNDVLENGTPYEGEEYETRLIINGKEEVRWYNFVYQPLKNDKGKTEYILVTSADVTRQVNERKKTEESNNQLIGLANALPQLVWIAEPNGKVIYYNDQVQHYAGAHKNAEGNWEWGGLVHKDDLEATSKAWEDAVQHGTVYEIEHRVQMKDLDYRWHISRAFPQRDSSGKILQWFGTATEIHKVKLSEEDYRDNEAKYRSLFNSMDQGFCVVEMIFDDNGKPVDYRFLEANPVFETQTGLHKAVGHTAKELVPDLEERWFNIYGNVAITGEPKRFTEGSEAMGRWFEVYAFRLEEDSKKKVAILFTDISERRKNELAIVQSEEQLKLLSDFMPQIVWVTDETGSHIFFNKRWYEYTGRTFEETKGQGWGDVLHPDDFERTWQVWNNSLNTGKYYEVEYRMKNSKGEYRWLLARATPFYNEQNEIVKWFGTCTDIHEQKTMEGKLEELINLRTKELMRSNDDLKQFAHVASHDLKEPVRKIKTFASRLETELSDDISVKGLQYISKIHKAANRMFNMIDGVLLYSSVEAQNNLIQDVDLNRLIESIKSDLELSLQEKNAEIHFDNLPEVEGALVLLYQLFYNLVNNSLKFSKPGEPTVITITSQQQNVRGKGFVDIIFKDNGIGFDQFYSKHIFNTFTRLHSKDQYEGSGLGLALCKKIVERHDGSIEAIGKPGEGATFLIRLPLRQDKKSI